MSPRARIEHDPTDPRHGTVNGYRNLACRCDACRRANTIEHANYMRANEWQRRLHASRELAKYWAGLSSHTYGPPGRKKRRARRKRLA